MIQLIFNQTMAYNGYYGSGGSSSRTRVGYNYYDNYDDDYYGSYYSSSKKSSYKSKYKSSWNWGSFGYTVSEEEPEDLFVKKHDSYYTPKDSEIRYRITSYNNDTKNNRDFIKELSRFFYYKMIDEKEFIDDRYVDETKLSESELEFVSNKKTMYDELWDKFVPGYTPLEQAMSIFNELIRQKQDSGDVTMQEAAEKVKGQSIQFNREIYSDPHINELLDMHEFSKCSKIEIMNLMSLFKNLGGEFKVEKEVDEKIVANSKLVRKKIMRDYSQLHMVDIYQKLLPTYNVKLLTKDLVVNTPIDKTEHKQKIIILLDYSGSMDETDKQQWVVAILVDRLKYVMKEEAEVFFSYFVHSTDQLHFHHIHNRETALEFWTQFSTEPNGGTTQIGHMVDYVGKQINDFGRLHNLDVNLSAEKPEILVINDGQDHVNCEEFTYKTNAISLVDSENEGLKELCIKNDGKYVFVADNNNIKTYSKGSVETHIKA